MVKILMILQPAVLILLMVLSACGDRNTGTVEADSVKGRKFIGPPSAVKSVSGCEGCGNRGYLFFGEDGRMDILWPGSDTIEHGTYTQERDTVRIVQDDDRRAFRFRLSEDGTELEGADTPVKLRDQRHPWR